MEGLTFSAPAYLKPRVGDLSKMSTGEYRSTSGATGEGQKRKKGERDLLVDLERRRGPGCGGKIFIEL